MISEYCLVSKYLVPECESYQVFTANCESTHYYYYFNKLNCFLGGRKKKYLNQKWFAKKKTEKQNIDKVREKKKKLIID